MDSTSERATELHTRIRQQEVVAELGQRALETDDFDRLMHDATVAVAETLDTEYCHVLELLPDAQEFTLRQGVGWDDGVVGNAMVPTATDSQAGYTLLSQEPIIVDNLAREDRFSGNDLLIDHDVTSGTTVIIGSVEEPWGVLGTFTTEQRSFTEHDANFVQSVANVLASAIEQHQIEQSLRKEKKQSQRIVEEVEDYAIFSLNPDGYVSSWNKGAEEITGYEESDIVGEHFSTLFPDDAREEDLPEQLLTEARETGRTEHEGWCVRKDGSRFWASDSITALYEDNELHGFTKVKRDLTDRRAYEREIEKTLNRITDGFIGLDANWDITYVNERGKEILDPDDRGLVGENFWDPFEPALGMTFEEEYREAMETQEPTHFEEYYPPLEVWFEVHAYPSESGLSIYFRDATEKKEREQELKESEQRYRTLAENFPNGIVTMFDDELRYTLAAGQAFEEFPISPPDAEGQPIEEVWPEHVTDAIEPAFRAALDGEKQVVEAEYLDREWIIHVVPITDDDETIFGGMTIAQDITERKEYERALEESERRYRTLVEHFPNGAVGLFDEDLCYTAVGGELLSEEGISPEERVGTTVSNIYPDEIIDEVKPHFHAALDGETNSFEVEYLDRDLFAYTLPVRNANDEIYAGMLVVQDVTERREYQRKLEESNERLEQFAYAASHDLQEPLRMVTSYLSLIESRYSDDLDDDAEEFLEFAVDGANRMREMIEGLLEYSRIDTQGDPFEPVDLDRLVEEVQEDLRMRIDESDAQITIEDLPRVEGDDSQLRQLFQNLLANAIEYSGDEPPEIHVEATRRGERWLISVHDEGVGIDPDDQDRVFEVFQRLHSHEEHSGTGIGLALCQRVVERHGGQIRVDSEPGEGTTFSFTLPAIAE